MATPTAADHAVHGHVRAHDPPAVTPSLSRLLPGRARDPERLPHQRRRRTRRILAQEGVFDAIVSLAGLLGRPVRNQAGQEIGRLEDIVARWADGQVYPPVSGLIIRVGRRIAFVPASAIDRIGHAEVLLRSSRLDLRDVVRRPGEVLLARDVLDHQLVDVEGVQVIRAADLYLAEVLGRVRLVGADVSTATLFRRLGPRLAPASHPRSRHRLGRHPALQRAVRRAGRRGLAGGAQDDATRGCTGCAPVSWPTCSRTCAATNAASSWPRSAPTRRRTPSKRCRPRTSSSCCASRTRPRRPRLLAAMEPDEAVDVLRDLPLAVRAEVLRYVPARMALQLRELLGYEEDEAGGIMTTALVTAKSGEKVKKVADRLSEARGTRARHRCGGRRRRRRTLAR